MIPVRVNDNHAMFCIVLDACTFGFRPALDEFLLTICDICGAVIKPQALRSHIGE